MNDLDLRLTDGGELTDAYAAEGEVKMTKQDIIEMIERAGFEGVANDTVYNCVAAV
jgi:2-iminoacetate synthase ThiH